MKKKQFAIKFARQLAKQYAGKCVAIINEKVVAIGSDRLSVFNRAKKLAKPHSKIGVFYFPTKKEMLTAL